MSEKLKKNIYIDWNWFNFCTTIYLEFLLVRRYRRLNLVVDSLYRVLCLKDILGLFFG